MEVLLEFQARLRLVPGSRYLHTAAFNVVLQRSLLGFQTIPGTSSLGHCTFCKASCRKHRPISDLGRCPCKPNCLLTVAKCLESREKFSYKGRNSLLFGCKFSC